MDVIGEDQALQAVLGRGDFSGIDNEALDFSQLEDYINDDDDTTIYFTDSLVNNDVKVSEANQTLKPPSTRPPPPPQQQLRPPTSTGPLLYTLTNSYKNGPTTYVGQPHPLPESPPDSGSEPPFSPAEEGTHGKIIPPSTTTPNLQEMLMQPPPPPLQGNDGMKHLLNYTNTHPLKHLPETLPNLVSQSSQPIGNPLPPSSVANTTLSMSTLPTMFGNNINPPGTHQNKKRKLSDSPNNTINPSILNGLVQIKQEPGSHSMLVPSRHCLSPDPGSNQSNTLTLSDEDYSFDFTSDPSLAFMDTSYQCIRFQPFQQQSWNTLCDCNLKELPTPNYRVDADKGFNFSNADDAFVCQKKNHFQVTVHVQLIGEPHFIKTPEGLKKIDHFYLHFSGVKMESPSQSIKVEQSQSDRSKKAFHPVQLEFNGEQVTKLTVGRLHFSETTSNNMRKKGKPNPDQRYFHLVVGLHAHCGDANYVVTAHASERIIVRASNPGQFENDVELCWQKGHIPDSIYHAGRVGINTDRPDESLVVHGNMKLTGHIMQPSDIRAKENIQEVDTKEQLRNLQQLRIVRYQYKPDFANHVGLILDEQLDLGVIAQEVQKVIPEAVKEAGDIILPNGQHISNFLVVNKERIFMENVGAVKELCKVTDNLENRIDELERMNRKLSKLKRIDSLKSTSSGSTVISHASSIPASTARRYHQRRRKPDDPSLCSNKIVQTTIAVLIIIMALCLVAMATLYILEWQSRHLTPSTQLSGEMPVHSSNFSSTQVPKLSVASDNSSVRVTNSGVLSNSAIIVSKQNTSLRNSHSSTTPSTIASISKPTYPKTKKPLPIGSPKNCISPTGHSTCPIYCCERDIQPSIIHHSSVTDGQSTQENNSTMVMNLPPYHLETATLSPQPSQVLDILDSPHSETKEETNDENSPYGNVPNTLGEINSPNDDDDDHKHLLSKREGKQRNPMPKARSDFFHSVFVPELNITINSNYSIADQRSGNHSFNIPISPFMPNISLTLQFQFTSTTGVIIDLCENHVNRYGCNISNNFVPQERRKEGENASWILPIGYFVDSSYKFRLPYNRGMNHQQVCDATLGEVGETFIEINFLFHRKCDNALGHISNGARN